MTYQETITYLYNSAPLFQNVGQGAYKEGLSNTQALDTYFGHPHHRFRTLHVAGTNGKGSCSHTLAAVLQEAGYKVGLYTSPHLVDFRERIRVNGSMVSEQFVIDFVELHRAFFEPLHPSFFELTTAMAFHYFAEQQIDIAVIEVGLGGRLDCTNIISPDLAVITNISHDHTGLLGDTLAQIAHEKAGIIKPHTPIIIGEYTKETRPVFEAEAQQKQAPITFAEDRPTIMSKESIATAAYDIYHTVHYSDLQVALRGYCQEKNVPILPGTANASDIEIALSLGLNTVKFFPAEPLGGIKMISALAAPYTTMKFMPTGGVSPKNMKDYLSNPKIVACGGTWMIDKKAMQEKNFAKIEELTRQAVREMLEIKIKHIGINVPTAEAKATAEMMARLFQGAVSETSKGYFGSPLIEVMNEGYHVGTHGHIAMGVSSTERAMAYFKAMGYEFDEESVTYDAHGDAKFAYFKGEFAGFGVHLVNN